MFVFQPHMPLFSIYSLALEQDQEQSMGLQQANITLHSQTFTQVNFADICCNVMVNSTHGCSTHCVDLFVCAASVAA